ncbi:MAG: ABC transporter substrate-binding protein [Actinomycetota bacterium]|nr:ABC transporter substrate-binding protein [Actinomycetota bacterium]MDQ2957888.1 ABC transporter substrate-binding protein [Actinomycetota bacterium]
MRAKFWRTRALVLLLAGALLATSACSSSKSGSSGSGGSTKLTIGVGGQSLLVYLPTTLAYQLGYYKEQGLDVKLEDLQAGSKALTALLGGSVDVTSGYYDHTIQTQAKGKSIESFVTMLQLPALALVVSPKYGKTVNSIADLKGGKIGVTAPGSSTDFFLNFLLKQAGMSTGDVSHQAIGGGSTAVAAMEQGTVNAAVMIDPAISELAKRDPNTKIVDDLRTQAGVQKVYGTSQYPAAVLYSSSSWVKAHPDVAKKLAAAIVKTLQWISSHTAADITAKMPASFVGTDKDLYTQAVEAAKPTYSQDGKMDPNGAAEVLKVLSSDPAIASAKIDLSTTYTNDLLPTS